MPACKALIPRSVLSLDRNISLTDFHRFNTSIHSSLHTICRFRHRGLSFRHEHEILILFMHLRYIRCSKGCWVKIIQCHRTNLSLFYKYRYKKLVSFVYILILLWNAHFCCNNLSWYCTLLHNVLVNDGFLQNFVTASYCYRPHNLFACCLPTMKIVTWGPWKLAGYQYHY